MKIRITRKHLCVRLISLPTLSHISHYYFQLLPPSQGKASVSHWGDDKLGRLLSQSLAIKPKDLSSDLQHVQRAGHGSIHSQPSSLGWWSRGGRIPEACWQLSQPMSSRFDEETLSQSKYCRGQLRKPSNSSFWLPHEHQHMYTIHTCAHTHLHIDTQSRWRQPREQSSLNTGLFLFKTLVERQWGDVSHYCHVGRFYNRCFIVMAYTSLRLNSSNWDYWAPGTSIEVSQLLVTALVSFPLARIAITRQKQLRRKKPNSSLKFQVTLCHHWEAKEAGLEATSPIHRQEQRANGMWAC